MTIKMTVKMTVKIDGYFSKAKGDVTRQINPQILKYF